MKMQGGAGLSAAVVALLWGAGCTSSGLSWRHNYRNELARQRVPAYSGELPAHYPDHSPEPAGPPAISTRKPQPAISGEVQEYIEAFPRFPDPDEVFARAAEDHPAHSPSSQAATPAAANQTSSMRAASLADMNPSGVSDGDRADSKVPVVQRVEARGVAAVPVRSTAAEPVTANTPAGGVSTSARASIDEEIEVLERRLADHPDDVGGQMRLRHLYLAQGRVEQARSRAKGLEPDRALLLEKMVDSVVAAEQAISGPIGVTEETVRTIGELHDWVRTQADLRISRAQLCTSIQSFGHFEVIPDDFFVSGYNNRAFLYCEIANFASERVDQGSYETRIAHRLELLTPQGQSVWHDDEAMEIRDLCVDHRTDFFFNRLVVLPPELNPGEYVLKVSVEDLNKQQHDETTLDLEIQPAGSARR